MLAHLLFPELHKNHLRALAIGAIVTATMLIGQAALAADTLPLTNVDARAVGKVSSASLAEPGTIYSGISIDSSEDVVKKSALASEAETVKDNQLSKDQLLRDAHTASAFLGFGVTKNLELSLGVHGTFEHVKPASRDALLADDKSQEGEAAAAKNWRSELKETGFSGASLLAKLQLGDWQGLKLAIAPFIKSGAGEQATYALTRSVSPKAGWLSILSYGARGVGEVSLNAGYRYRDAETIGDLTLGNEFFYKASLRADLSRSFGLFVAGEGRRLMVARQDGRDDETGKLQYKPQEAGEVNAGFQAQLGDAVIMAYAGTAIKQAKGFGFGKNMAGLSVTYAMGNVSGDRPRTSFADDVKREMEDQQNSEASTSRAKLKNDKEPVAQPASEEYDEMIGADVDPLAAVDDKNSDDFTEINKKIAADRQASESPSEDEKVEQELNKIRVADAKAESERLQAEKAAEEKRRHEALQQAKEDSELLKEWNSEANKELDKVEGVSDDELNWNGLEQ